MRRAPAWLTGALCASACATPPPRREAAEPDLHRILTTDHEAGALVGHQRAAGASEYYRACRAVGGLGDWRLTAGAVQGRLGRVRPCEFEAPADRRRRTASRECQDDAAALIRGLGYATPAVGLGCGLATQLPDDELNVGGAIAVGVGCAVLWVLSIGVDLPCPEVAWPPPCGFTPRSGLEVVLQAGTRILDRGTTDAEGRVALRLPDAPPPPGEPLRAVLMDTSAARGWALPPGDLWVCPDPADDQGATMVPSH